MDTPTLFKGKKEQKRQVHVLFILLLYHNCFLFWANHLPLPKTEGILLLPQHFQGCFKIFIKVKSPKRCWKLPGSISF